MDRVSGRERMRWRERERMGERRGEERVVFTEGEGRRRDDGYTAAERVEV